MKIASLYNFNKKNLEGLIEIFKNINIKEVLNKDELIEIMQDIKEIY